MFRKKNQSLILIFISCFFIVACTHTSNTRSVQTNIGNNEKDFISERIEMFTTKHFTKMEKCDIDFVNQEGRVRVELVADFGSITFKNEIWHHVAHHAMNLIYIFPEITEYDYVVYDGKDNKLMDLMIDKEGITNLPQHFTNGGQGGNYRFCFTRVDMTKMGQELPLDERFFEGWEYPKN